MNDMALGDASPDALDGSCCLWQARVWSTAVALRDRHQTPGITSRQREPPAHGNMAAGPHAVQSLSRCARFAPSSACATTGLLPHAQQRDGSSGSRSPGVSAAPAPALALGCVAAQDAALLRGGNRRGCAWCAKHPSSQCVRHRVQQPDKTSTAACHAMHSVGLEGHGSSVRAVNVVTLHQPTLQQPTHLCRLAGHIHLKGGLAIPLGVWDAATLARACRGSGRGPADGGQSSCFGR